MPCLDALGSTLSGVHIERLNMQRRAVAAALSLYTPLRISTD
jgi:hypothetical protein